MTVAAAIILLQGCSGDAAQDAENPGAEEEEPQKERDPYDEYIHSAIESVAGKGAGEGDTQPAEQVQPGKTISIDRTAPPDFQVSSEDTDDEFDPFTKQSVGEESPSPSPTVDPNATPTPSPTPYITPEEFDVGKCCIYINGESDSAYGTEVVTAINKVREDLGYKKLVNNKSLATCADRRTRETAASFSHIRPNGQYFPSLAPEHFKAEMLIIDNQKAENTVDDLIKRDPISRNLIFTEKYQSIGASSFKCNGMRYTVVAFGL